MTTNNQTLADELEAINSIYEPDTLAITTTTTTTQPHDNTSTTTNTILTLPSLPFSFTIAFPATYPDVPPVITGTQSTGANTKKGDGEAALGVLRDVLGSVYVSGQVCLFDLVEEVTPLLTSSLLADVTTADGGEVAGMDDDLNSTTAVSGSSGTDTGVESSAQAVRPLTSALTDLHIQPLSPSTFTSTSTPTPKPTPTSTTHHQAQAPTPTSEPAWILSDPLVVSKSTFIARCLPVTTLSAATTAISHLLSTNKRVGTATHNITAWRIRNQSPDGAEIVIQDCDDDGETAAGGRLLHLMQLMGVWNCVVVVTRWYGGVKLGPDRFRCINLVAREALVRGGFGQEDAAAGEKGKGKKGRKKGG